MTSPKSTPTLEELRAATELVDPRSDNYRTVEEAVYDMKVGGHSVREIAVGCQIPEAEVEAIIGRCAEQSRNRLSAELSIAAILEIDRLDRLLKALWPAAAAGDFSASDRVMAISKERRRLMGTDAPEVKASLNMSSRDQIDLTKLTLPQLRAWEDIQRTLAAPATKTVTGVVKAKRQIGLGAEKPAPAAEAAVASRSDPEPSGS